MIEVTAAALAAQPFLRGMPPSQLGRLAEAATDVKFLGGHRIFDEGGFAARFWLIQSGHVSLDMQIPGEGPVTIDSIGTLIAHFPLACPGRRRWKAPP